MGASSKAAIPTKLIENHLPLAYRRIMLRPIAQPTTQTRGVSVWLVVRSDEACCVGKLAVDDSQLVL